MSKPELLMLCSYPDADMAELDQAFTLHRGWEEGDVLAWAKAHGGNVRAIATHGGLGAPGTLMEALPKLEIVSCYGVGTDAIDLGHARSRGIAVTNTPSVLDDDVADLAIGLLLALVRNIVAADGFVRGGRWGTSAFALSPRVSGKRLGIAGMGRIGQAIARRAAAFDMEIAYTSRTARSDVPYRHLETPVALADWCDFLVLIVPGGSATEGLVDRQVLEALGRDGFLVNVSRGSVIDENALLDALEAGTIRGAALDVFRSEPNIDPRFLGLSNVLLQPHHGSATHETRKQMGRLVIDNLTRHFDGEPLLTPVIR